MQSQSMKSNGSVLLDYFKSLGEGDWNIDLTQYQKSVDFKLSQKVITFGEVQEFYTFEDQKTFFQMHSQTQWTDQEWKILIWIVIQYCTMHKMNLLKMNDWEMVEKLIKFKSSLNCQYKWLCHVIGREDRLQWCQEEEQMLKVEVENSKNLKWHEIQFQIFTKSNGRYFKKAKQCRERWNNYLDPRINRSYWKPEEDLCLMKLAQSEGLKWSKISYKMKNRTENQVKNRFKSLINKESKGSQMQLDMDQLINNIIQKLVPQQCNASSDQMQEQKPQKVICLDRNINYIQQQQFLIYQYQYYLAQQQYQMCYNYYQGEQSIKSEDCHSEKISRSNSFCGLLDKLSLDSKSLTQELNKQYVQEIEVPINNNITKSQQQIAIPDFLSQNQGKVKSNKQRFKFSSGDQ
ncbi:unnamed protein product (macronuclear) [Paramecium tetraurelia]|uniref:Uncharacterized protein n=1 Tax=Paramecium tetraurelia TaxID=5888 RepID=A0EGD8_PARTE|nr:uncharacterized protein GSPATT00026703001 [Paramecium tetraurelia]CAK94379.1 unnamed protein product [Paramecium tetraurelia]|eukprot:XP_001461752.1 hypothetical protein (macronuclear) [Paramecium tetraurelia strain d4-2]